MTQCLRRCFFITSVTKINLLSLYITIAYADKPKILITDPVVRATPGHFVWCSAEGIPPINISIFKNSTPLTNGNGLVMAPLYETGNYSCVASNEAGTDTKDFSVTIVGKMYFPVGASRATMKSSSF